ncbi:hypothetical protein BDR26DRAFT_849896 [Obelidium mucronatum]|nr:hypothetical protein BDR26DRAFT_849896 [Obelidium mucronatum]
MTLQAASSTDFALDGDLTSSIQPLDPGSTSLASHSTIPTQQSLLSPGALLFNSTSKPPKPPVKTSQLKFNQQQSPPSDDVKISMTNDQSDQQLVTPNSPCLPGKKLLKSTASKKKNSTSTNSAEESMGDTNTMDAVEGDVIKMEEDGESSIAGLSRSLAGKKGTLDEKKFPCTEADCTATFAQLAHLKIHLRRHTGERPFVCTFCDKTFNQKGNLKTHERKHTGVKPFKCQHPGCTKEFSQQGNLKTHEKIHLNVKQFTCEQCSKSFSQFGNLKSHIQKVHEKPQIMRRPRANSNTAIAKPPKSGTAARGTSRQRLTSSSNAAAAAAAQLISSSAAASGTSYLLDRYYTPSLTSRPRASSTTGVFGDRLSTSLSTPPPSDWGFFESRINDFSLHDFSSDDDDDESEEDEGDEGLPLFEESEDDENEFEDDVFGNFDQLDEDDELDDFIGGEVEGVIVDEEVKLLNGRNSDQVGGNSFVSNNGFGASSYVSNSGFGANSFSSSVHSGVHHDAAAAAAGGSSVMIGATLSPSLRALKLRGRNASMGKLDLDDGLQFIIDGIEPDHQQEMQSQGDQKLNFDYQLSEHEALDDEEAARVLASVSYSPVLSPFMIGSGSYNTNGNNHNNSSSNQLLSSSALDQGLLPLLAATAATEVNNSMSSGT